MNVYDIVIIAVIAAVLSVAVVLTVRRKKRGGCSCGECSSCGVPCAKKKEDKEQL